MSIDNFFRQSPHSILRKHSKFETPNQQFFINAHDGIKLSCTFIKRGSPKNKCIIMLNSANRSMHQFGMVLLAEWFANNFDVAVFDLRGHYKSKGFWNPKDSFLDVKDMASYIRDRGYQKIGVFGKSIGGWSALMDSAFNKSIDSIVALSPPIGSLRLNKDLQRYINLYLYWPRIIVKPIIEAITKVRFHTLSCEHTLIGEISHVSPIPMLLMYYQNDPMLEINSIMAKKVFEQALDPKKFVELKGSGHGLELFSIKQIISEADMWFEETL